MKYLQMEQIYLELDSCNFGSSIVELVECPEALLVCMGNTKQKLKSVNLLYNVMEPILLWMQKIQCVVMLSRSFLWATTISGSYIWL